ncbi:response regulator [Paenibacillus beijingensis]|uniref:AraC family transcriptional regulator n=1 Tax=Paenibacillus beijingensis TaxID=1126833 RepID=A0A0D5NG21_9BACL|nr:response regulator [Paenibacillus beijingensis]AJY74090.1 hypothetical protein VN24_05080 [Paenibacillus beijingensis]
MRVLLVDDEPHVRKSVRLLIDWKSLGIDTVLEADNGVAATTIIQAMEPEIVIMDMMMPFKNGMELLEWMQQHGGGRSIIVISGHSDFEFMRHAIRHGGMDYLLKPVDKSELQKAVRKAVDSCNAAKQQMLELRQLSGEMNEMRSLRRDKLLAELLAGPASETVQEALLRELPSLRNVKRCTAAIIRPGFAERGMSGLPASRLHELLLNVVSIAGRALGPEEKGLAFLSGTDIREVALLIWDGLPEAVSLAGAIAQTLSESLKVRCDIGVGGEREFPHFLHQSYREASEALRSRNMLHLHNAVQQWSQETRERDGRLKFYKFEETIYLAIRSANAGQIEAVVRQWIDSIRAVGFLPLNVLQQWREEYQLFKTRLAEELLPNDSGQREDEPAFLIPLQEDGGFSLEGLQQELNADLIRLQQQLLRVQQSANRNVIGEIAQFLESNYMRDITLQEISDRFYLNKEYISRRFKNQFDETITDYVNRIRIKKAKVLLLNPQLKIAEIAQMVGYHDDKYFSRVFKKWVGQPPNEYRGSVSGV